MASVGPDPLGPKPHVLLSCTRHNRWTRHLYPPSWCLETEARKFPGWHKVPGPGSSQRSLVSPKVLHCGLAGVQAESVVALVARLQADPAGLGWRQAILLGSLQGPEKLLQPPVGTKNKGQVRSQLSPEQTPTGRQLSSVSSLRVRVTGQSSLLSESHWEPSE